MLSRALGYRRFIVINFIIDSSSGVRVTLSPSLLIPRETRSMKMRRASNPFRSFPFFVFFFFILSQRKIFALLIFRFISLRFRENLINWNFFSIKLKIKKWANNKIDESVCRASKRIFMQNFHADKLKYINIFPNFLNSFFLNISSS